MTNTTQINAIDSLHAGMIIQLANGSIHQITAVKIRRTPRRHLLREARVRSDVTRGWVDLLEQDWRIVRPASGIIPGAHNSADGLHHSQSCTGMLTTVHQLTEGWSKTCRRCGFAVIGCETRDIAEAAYVADKVGMFH